MSAALSATKARLILHHGYVHDRAGRQRQLSPAQRRYLGAIASGSSPWTLQQRRTAMKATVRRENPGAIPGTALEIRYRRAGNQPGLYKHPFEHPVRMIANRDGSVTLRGTKKLHADDRDKDFDQYVHPHHGRWNAMARRRRRVRRRSTGGSTLWLWLGIGALLLFKPELLSGSPVGLPVGTVTGDPLGTGASTGVAPDILTSQGM